MHMLRQAALGYTVSYHCRATSIRVVVEIESTIGVMVSIVSSSL